MHYKHRGFYYQVTPRPDPHADWLLHVSTAPDSQHLYCQSFETERQAYAGAEAWIDEVHVAVRDYYRL